MNLEKKYLERNKTKLNIANTFTVCAIIVCLFYSVSISSRASSESSSLIIALNETVAIREDEISERVQAETELKQLADEFKDLGNEMKDLGVELKDEFKELGNELKALGVEIKTKLSNFPWE